MIDAERSYTGQSDFDEVKRWHNALINQLELSIRTITQSDPSILVNQDHRLYGTLCQAMGRLETAKQDNPSIMIDDIRRQIQTLRESIENLTPKQEGPTLVQNTLKFGFRFRTAVSAVSAKVVAFRGAATRGIRTDSLRKTSAETESNDLELPDESSQASGSNQQLTPNSSPLLQDEQPEDTGPNHLLAQAKNLLLDKLSTPECLSLTEHYQYLIDAVNGAETSHLIYIAPEELVDKGLTGHYTFWNKSNGETANTVDQISLSYISIDGIVTNTGSSCSIDELKDFLSSNSLPFNECNTLTGVTIPSKIFDRFLQNVGGSVPTQRTAILSDLIEKLRLATLEVDFHQAHANLYKLSQQTVEMPECELYIMPIPEEKQSNFVNCYIWDSRRLVYIPPYIKGEDQISTQPNNDGEFEEVTINDLSRLSSGINKLKNKSKPAATQMSLSNTDYFRLIKDNGGHTHYAIQDHEKQFKNAEHLLDDLSDDNLTECEIVYTQPEKNKTKQNTLYLYLDNDELKYAVKKGSRPCTAPSQPNRSFIDNFSWLFPRTPTPEPTVPTSYLPEALEERDLIRGTLSLDTDSELKRHVDYAIKNHMLLDAQHEQALWNAVFAQNSQMDRNDFRQKDNHYESKIQTRTERLKKAYLNLDQYIQSQQESIQTVLDKAKNELQDLISNDEIFNIIRHNDSSRHTIALYQESTRLFKKMQDAPDIKLKRLAIAINTRTGELIKNTPGHYSGLPIQELPTILRVLNTPVTSPIRYSQRSLNISMMLLGIALISASIGLIVLSNGLSTPISFAGITLGTEILANAMLITAASGTALYAKGLFFGPRTIITEPNDSISEENGPFSVA